MLRIVHLSGDLMLYNLPLISNKQNSTGLLIDVMVFLPLYSSTMDMSSWFLANRPNNYFKNPHGHCAKSSYHSVNPHAQWENHWKPLRFGMGWVHAILPRLAAHSKNIWLTLPCSCPNSSHALYRHNGLHPAFSIIRFWLCSQIFLLGVIELST